MFVSSFCVVRSPAPCSSESVWKGGEGWWPGRSRTSPSLELPFVSLPVGNRDCISLGSGVVAEPAELWGIRGCPVPGMWIPSW